MNPTHERLAPLITWVARRFWETYGGDRGDILQSAWVIFLECEKTFDPELGTLEKRAEFLIFRGLLNQRRQQIERPQTSQLDWQPPARREFNARAFLSEFSDDVAAIIEIFWETPPRCSGESVFRTFCERLGCDKSQTSKIVRELRAALIS